MITTKFHDHWFLSGATASGKTRVALHLARVLNAEIIAMDSMTVYRHMDIGTAKPTATERQAAVHHLLDIRDPDEEYSLANYLADVERVVAEVRGRGKQVLFVGGTPLYLKALLRGVFQGPPADWSFRKEVETEIATVGTAALHARLDQVDPVTAAKLPPSDVRRIIRALEVYRLTGAPISHWQTQFEEGADPEQCRVAILAWRREELVPRIHRRVDRMFAEGFIDEVERLRDRFPNLSRTARQAVGYQEVLAMLNGQTDLATTIEEVKTRTRRFAKRQRTWFRGLSECRFVPCSEQDGDEALAARVVQALSSTTPSEHFG